MITYLKKIKIIKKTKTMAPTEDTVETPVEDAEGVFEDRINDLVSRLEENTKETKAIVTELKTLKKEHLKIVKKITGSRRKKVPKDPNAPKKAPSGFAKPTKISAELAAFLGVSEGDLIARPDVTKGITKYVKEHNLQKEENKRIIDLTKPGGEALVDLLNVPPEQELTFFNLQKYLKIHFPASASKEPKAPKVPKEPKAKVAKVTKAKETKPRAKKAEADAEVSAQDEEAPKPKKATRAKKTAPKEPEAEADADEEAPKSKKAARPKKAAPKEPEAEDEEEAPKPKKATRAKKAAPKEAEAEVEDEEVPKPKTARASKAKATKVAKDEEEVTELEEVQEEPKRRRRRTVEESS